MADRADDGRPIEASRLRRARAPSAGTAPNARTGTGTAPKAGTGTAPKAGTGTGPGRWHEPVTRWIARRSFPLLAAAGLIAVGMASSTWWEPHLAGSPHWQLPDDIRGTLLAARRLLHLDIGGLYTPPTGLVSFPRTALVLVPGGALLDALGPGLCPPRPPHPHPLPSGA